VDRHRRDLEAREDELERERTELGGQLSTLAQARDERAAEVATLRDELAGVHAATERRTAENARLREELAAAQVARDAAVGEAAGLRSELQRIGTELAATRERVAAESGDLGEASRLLADARALAEELRGT
jgi:uncharacterized coiled-coil DUF342 family protein